MPEVSEPRTLLARSCRADQPDPQEVVVEKTPLDVRAAVPSPTLGPLAAPLRPPVLPASSKEVPVVREGCLFGIGLTGLLVCGVPRGDAMRALLRSLSRLSSSSSLRPEIRRRFRGRSDWAGVGVVRDEDAISGNKELLQT